MVERGGPEPDYLTVPGGDLELLRKLKASDLQGVKRKGLKIMFGGIDIGSLTAKAILVGDKGIVAGSVIATGTNSQKAGEMVFQMVLDSAGCSRGDVKYIVSTGYGRTCLSFANRTVTELTCHARGAHYLNPSIRTVIDIGGQDSKVIRLDENGTMRDFVMNDKCAAGTGRFLEVMARALEVDLEELGPFSLRSRKPCSINSTCTVFAESEVVSLSASGEEKEDIAAGLHHAIAKRVGNMAKRLGIEENIVFVGGVAKNVGVRKTLEDFLEVHFTPLSEDPQIIGALGAALLAKGHFKD